MDSKSNKLWSFWYQGCISQNIFIVLSCLGGILTVGYAIFIARLKPELTYGSSRYRDIVKKSKAEIIIWLILSFVISFVINNLIFVAYCNNRPKQMWANVLASIALLIFVSSIISGIVSWILGAIMLSALFV